MKQTIIALAIVAGWGFTTAASNPLASSASTTSTAARKASILLDQLAHSESSTNDISIDETALFRHLEEYLAEQELPCELECRHGGTCEFVPGTLEDWRFYAQTGILIQRCVCPDGYGGIGCEIPVERCLLSFGPPSDDEIGHEAREIHTCELSGRPCDALPDGSYSCACHVADAVDANLVGHVCRKWNTEYCAGQLEVTKNKDDSGAGNLYLCTNGGKCQSDFIAAQLAPGDMSVNREYANAGCVCNEHFYGPHCEFLDFSPQHNIVLQNKKGGIQEWMGDTNGDHDDGNGGALRAVIALVTVGAVAALLMAVYRRRRHAAWRSAVLMTTNNERVFKDPTNSNHVEFSDISLPPGPVANDPYMDAVTTTELQDIDLEDDDDDNDDADDTHSHEEEDEENANLEEHNPLAPPTAIMPNSTGFHSSNDDDDDDAHRFT